MKRAKHDDAQEALEFPEVLPLLPVRDLVVFPYMIVPLFVSRQVSMAAVNEALRRDRLVFLVAQREHRRGGALGRLAVRRRDGGHAHARPQARRRPGSSCSCKGWRRRRLPSSCARSPASGSGSTTTCSRKQQAGEPTSRPRP